MGFRNSVHREFYDSLDDFMKQMHDFRLEDLGDTAEKQDNYRNASRIIADTSADGKFYGNYEKVYDKFKKHNVKQEASVLATAIDSLVGADFDEQRWQYRTRLEEGDEVDVNRYLDGQDRYWNGVRKVRHEKRVVRVYVHVGGHCGRTPKQLAIGGALAVAITEAMEAAGIAVELWGVCYASGCYSNGDNALAAVLLKPSDTFADLGVISYICGNHHVFRNSFFRAWCKIGVRDAIDVDYFLGRHAEVDKDKIGLTDEEAEQAIIVPSFYDVPSAKEWLDGQFNKMKEKGKVQ
jgi:hypothetical protein